MGKKKKFQKKILLKHKKKFFKFKTPQKKIKETRIQRMEMFHEMNQYFETNQEKNKLKRNENGRPSLYLKELEKTAIHTKTQEIYDTLMQIYECGNWKWNSNKFPTEYNRIKNYLEIMCIEIKDKFRFGKLEEFNKKKRIIITPKEFYEIQDITDSILNHFCTSKMKNFFFHNMNN